MDGARPKAFRLESGAPQIFDLCFVGSWLPICVRPTKGLGSLKGKILGINQGVLLVLCRVVIPSVHLMDHSVGERKKKVQLNEDSSVDTGCCFYHLL